MFERFSPDARAVLAWAKEDATSRNHNFLGTEHLLLGLLRLTDSAVAAVLGGAGVTTTRAGARLDSIVGRGDRQVPTDHDALATIGIDLGEVYQTLRDQFGEKALCDAMRKAPPNTGQPFTPRTKKVLELSLREARAMGDDVIRPEHVLLAICREGKGVAAQMLGELAPGVDFRARLLETMGATSR